jgi:hypothetical protein
MDKIPSLILYKNKNRINLIYYEANENLVPIAVIENNFSCFINNFDSLKDIMVERFVTIVFFT